MLFAGRNEIFLTPIPAIKRLILGRAEHSHRLTDGLGSPSYNPFYLAM